MREAVEASSLAAEAYTIVRQRILRGELRLGQVISRRKLAAELGMSFLPVSEALLRLEFEGLLESRPRAGTRVRIHSPEDVRGHYVVREALEVQAAMLFATAATSSERAELRKLAVRVDALSMQSDRMLYLELHQKLHRRIAECTRCAPLCDAIEKTHALATIWFCVMRKPLPTDSRTRHQDLVEALVEGDPVTAAEAVRAHLAVGMQHTLEVLEPYFRLRKASGRTFYRSERKLKYTGIEPVSVT
ncbi:MAG: GntR family transcriptional regulator [Acidobacteria bacterium]|nr:GntR family transcriptional regulator [Acidobacteriota bacterium]